MNVLSEVVKMIDLIKSHSEINIFIIICMPQYEVPIKLFCCPPKYDGAVDRWLKPVTHFDGKVQFLPYNITKNYTPIILQIKYKWKQKTNGRKYRDIF